MPYGHLTAATVTTLGVCQGHSSIASFFSILRSESRGLSAIVELLVCNNQFFNKINVVSCTGAASSAAAGMMVD